MDRLSEALLVCRHGNKVDVEFSADRADGFYRLIARMPVCRECMIDAIVDVMDRSRSALARAGEKEE